MKQTILETKILLCLLSFLFFAGCGAGLAKAVMAESPEWTTAKALDAYYQGQEAAR